MSFLLMLRIALISLTTFVCFDKIYEKADDFWKILFSVAFAMCGNTLINYTNIFWLDNAMLFPLSLLGIKKIIEEKKIWLYVLTVFLNFVVCYQIAYCVLFYVLAMSIVLVLFYIPKGERKNFTFLLGIGTIFAIMLDGLLLIPGLTQALNSSRLSGGITSILFGSGNEITNGVFTEKASFLLLSPIALFFFLKLQLHIKKDKKNILSIDYILLITGILPILFERINLIWHGGSYLGFPFRFAFISIFALINGAMYYIAKYNNTKINIKIKELKLNKNSLVMIITCVLLLIVNIVCLVILFPNINHEKPSMLITPKAFVLLLIYNAIVIFETFIMTKIKEEYIIRIFIATNMLITIIGLGLCYIGAKPEYRRGKEWSDVTLGTSIDLMNKLEENNNLYRTKDSENLLNENHSLIVKQPSIASWLHLVNKEQFSLYHKLGYSVHGNKLEDTGGTVVSDAILNVKYIFSKSELDSYLYDQIDTIDEFKIYQYKNTLPIGLVYDKINEVEDLPSNNVFENQNLLYSSLMNDDKKILECIDSEKSIDSESSDKLIYKIEVKEKSYLYFDLNETMNRLVTLKVNGKEFRVPSLNIYNNSIYPANTNNEILNLGVYENEEVTVEIDYMLGKELSSNIANFATFKIADYNRIFEKHKNEQSSIDINGNKIKVKVSCEEDGKSLFLPIMYDKGWTAKLNGKEINVDKVFENFIGIDLINGENIIELTFVPTNLITGTIITIVTIIGILIFYLLRKMLSNNSILNNLAYIIYIILIIIFYIDVYGISILRTIL